MQYLGIEPMILNAQYFNVSRLFRNFKVCLHL